MVGHFRRPGGYKSLSRSVRSPAVPAVAVWLQSVKSASLVAAVSHRVNLFALDNLIEKYFLVAFWFKNKKINQQLENPKFETQTFLPNFSRLKVTFLVVLLVPTVGLGSPLGSGHISGSDGVLSPTKSKIDNVSDLDSEADCEPNQNN